MVAEEWGGSCGGRMEEVSEAGGGGVGEAVGEWRGEEGSEGCIDRMEVVSEGERGSW